MINTENYDDDKRNLIESVLQKYPDMGAGDSEYVHFNSGDRVCLDGYFTLADLKIFCEILENLKKEESHESNE